MTARRSYVLRQLSVLILALACLFGTAGPSGAAARSAAVAVAAPSGTGGQHESSHLASARQGDADAPSRVAPAAAAQSLAGLTTHPADLAVALLLVLAAFFLGRGRRRRPPHALLVRFSAAPARAPPLCV